MTPSKKMGILAISIFATGMYDDIAQTLKLKDLLVLFF